MARFTEQGKVGKQAADKLSECLANEKMQDWLEPQEREILSKAHGILTRWVVDNHGPAWNASEEQWEY